MTDQGWQREFDDLIPLPDGRNLITLHDAATFIAKLPNREHDAPEWQAAIEALMLVADLAATSAVGRPRTQRVLTAGRSCTALLSERHDRVLQAEAGLALSVSIRAMSTAKLHLHNLEF